MSVALESLMRQTLSPESPPRQRSGIVSFLLIGAGAAIGFVILNSIAIQLFPAQQSGWVSGVCYGLFVLPVYWLHRRYSFRSSLAHVHAFPRYLAVQGVALGLAALFGAVLHGVIGLPSVPASVLVIALTSGVNFLVLRSWAFAWRGRTAAVPA